MTRVVTSELELVALPVVAAAISVELRSVVVVAPGVAVAEVSVEADGEVDALLVEDDGVVVVATEPLPLRLPDAVPETLLVLLVSEALGLGLVAAVEFRASVEVVLVEELGLVAEDELELLGEVAARLLLLFDEVASVALEEPEAEGDVEEVLELLGIVLLLARLLLLLLLVLLWLALSLPELRLALELVLGEVVDAVLLGDEELVLASVRFSLDELVEP